MLESHSCFSHLLTWAHHFPFKSKYLLLIYDLPALQTRLDDDPPSTTVSAMYTSPQSHAHAPFTHIEPGTVQIPSGHKSPVSSGANQKYENAIESYILYTRFLSPDKLLRTLFAFWTEGKVKTKTILNICSKFYV